MKELKPPGALYSDKSRSLHHERLTELYALARDDLKTYLPDKLEKIDRNFNLVRTAILGLPPEDWGDDHD